MIAYSYDMVHYGFLSLLNDPLSLTLLQKLDQPNSIDWRIQRF